MINGMTKMTAVARGLAEHRRLPCALALAAVILMLPALPVGLLGDDLVQRLNQFAPAELAARALDTGFVAGDSGKLATVLGNLFGYVRGKEAATRARDYGIAPWWAPEDWRAALWRPLTAFTHWLDYRLYPNSPGLMHAQNIAWYAAAVFLAATLYRRIATAAGGRDLQGKLSDSSARVKMQSGVCVAALAASLWLLDKNTYVPVMYVANRGFIISLVFGLLCLQAHLRWRTGHSGVWMWLSALCLLLSLLANEGGASTLAFLMAYAMVLEAGGWRERLRSLLPAAVVVIGWRAVYAGGGFGVRNFPGYIDPGYAPLLFVENLVPRANALVGGQLTGLPPELALALNAKWQMILALLFAGFSLICAVVFLPVVRRDGTARFWAVMMLLALAPAATVAPISKNLGFIALGAFGVVASFLVGFAAPQERAAMPGLLRAMSWCVAVWLVAAHIAGALGGRMALALASPSIPKMAKRACAFEHSPEIGERDVVVINDPTITCAFVPFDRAYRGQPLPRTMRVLVPGSTPFEVKRPDATTLILTAKGSDLFACPAVGPIHICYACKAADDFLFGERVWERGERVTVKGLVAEILEVSPRGAPRSVAFHFDKPLESDGMVWLFFDWRRLAHLPFVPPRIGEAIEIAGPGSP
jgi:branched-subunit amino acid transport protein